MKRGKLAAAVLVTLALSPGTFLRTPIPDGPTADLGVTRVTDLPEPTSRNGFTRRDVWEISSSRVDFGGYSALLDLNANLRLFSDRGKRLTLPVPSSPGTLVADSATVWNRGAFSSTPPDIEAATRDPATGDYWLAFEAANVVIRYTAGSEFVAARRPPDWKEWPSNSGAEAMARLPDGRFLVFPESGREGLIYPGDPAGKVESLRFAVGTPREYNPTDMAALPDGRVLVLLRKLAWGVPPFASAIAIADPGAVGSGDTLDLELLVELDTILPSENYEGLAVDGVDADGTVRLWLVSDDNLSAFQRTLLVRLDWREE